MSGNILLWHNPTPERWGAFAGGFEEVDENVEYEEREDEFDIVRFVLASHIELRMTIKSAGGRGRNSTT